MAPNLWEERAKKVRGDAFGGYGQLSGGTTGLGVRTDEEEISGQTLKNGA